MLTRSRMKLSRANVQGTSALIMELRLWSATSHLTNPDHLGKN